jgi:hypothetical protein
MVVVLRVPSETLRGRKIAIRINPEGIEFLIITRHEMPCILKNILLAAGTFKSQVYLQN